MQCLFLSRSSGALGAALLRGRISFATLLFSVRIIAPMPRQTKRDESFPRIRTSCSLGRHDILASLTEPPEKLHYLVDLFGCMPSTITPCFVINLFRSSTTLLGNLGQKKWKCSDVAPQSLPFHCRANVSITLSIRSEARLFDLRGNKIS